MSHIDISRTSLASDYESIVCLTKRDCAILLPYLKKAAKQAQKQYDTLPVEPTARRKLPISPN